jgi:hypothetical protein
VCHSDLVKWNIKNFQISFRCVANSKLLLLLLIHIYNFAELPNGLKITKYHRGNVTVLFKDIYAIDTVAVFTFLCMFQKVLLLGNLKSVALTSMLAAVWEMKKFSSWLRKWERVSMFTIK